MFEDVVAAYNAKDLDVMMRLFAPQAELVFGSFPPYRGHDAIKEFWRWDFETFADAAVTVHRAVSGGPVEMFEWTWTGTNTGPLDLPPLGLSVPATNKRATVSGIDVLEIDGGLIAAHRLYFQEAALLTQLGVMPAPAVS
jgi:hypothetical protein